jgi:glycine C-acetyltransferase
MNLPVDLSQVSLGKVRDELARQGVTELSEVAENLQAVMTYLHQVNPFAFHIFTERGIDAQAKMVSQDVEASQECILWAHNVYLGLNRHPKVIERAAEALRTYGTGCGASPPIAGLSAVHAEVARRVASMTGQEKAILFPTGFTANLGALSALPGRDDLVLMDRECHASMFQGVTLSGAKWLAFRHNDLADLEQMLEAHRAQHPNVFVIVETAYSMSGDLGPIKELVALKKKHRFYLFVDEAHTFGFYGENGRGYCHQLGVLDQVDFVTSTFSKATASIGGFVSGKAALCSVIEVGAKSYLAQACFPPADAAVILACLDEIEREPAHAAALHENNRYMRQRLTQAGFDLGTSQSPVIPIRIADLTRLNLMASRLCAEGIFAQPITEPIVLAGQSRLRFIVTARHTRQQIDRTVDALARHARGLELL